MGISAVDRDRHTRSGTETALDGMKRLLREAA